MVRLPKRKFVSTLHHEYLRFWSLSVARVLAVLVAFIAISTAARAQGVYESLRQEQLDRLRHPECEAILWKNYKNLTDDVIRRYRACMPQNPYARLCDQTPGCREYMMR